MVHAVFSNAEFGARVDSHCLVILVRRTSKLLRRKVAGLLGEAGKVSWGRKSFGVAIEAEELAILCELAAGSLVVAVAGFVAVGVWHEAEVVKGVVAADL